jgi:diacylglycerol kinase (ATP)
MAKTGATGITRIINAAGYSWKGLKSAYRNEAAFRQEIWLAAVLIPVAIHFGRDIPERAILIASLVFILVVELLNSAIEAVVDRQGDDFHELAGRAKDMGSAAVLFAFITSGLVWLAVLI